MIMGPWLNGTRVSVAVGLGQVVAVVVCVASGGNCVEVGNGGCDGSSGSSHFAGLVGVDQRGETTQAVSKVISRLKEQSLIRELLAHFSRLLGYNLKQSLLAFGLFISHHVTDAISRYTLRFLSPIWVFGAVTQ